MSPFWILKIDNCEMEQSYFTLSLVRKCSVHVVFLDFLHELVFVVHRKALLCRSDYSPWCLTLNVWRRWLDRDMSRTNEKLLPETCLCVCITPAISRECISASRTDIGCHSFVYWLQGHALYVSLYHCHQGSKHWRRAVNSHNSGAVYACKDGPNALQARAS